MLNKYFLLIVCVVVLVAIYFPNRHARHYSYVHDNNVLHELIPSTGKNDPTNLKICSYEQIISNGSEVDRNNIYRVQYFDNTLKGKRFHCEICFPVHLIVMQAFSIIIENFECYEHFTHQKPHKSKTNPPVLKINNGRKQSKLFSLITLLLSVNLSNNLLQR